MGVIGDREEEEGRRRCETDWIGDDLLGCYVFDNKVQDVHVRVVGGTSGTAGLDEIGDRVGE